MVSRPGSRSASGSISPHTGQTATTSDCNSLQPVKCQHYQENLQQFPAQMLALLATETDAVSSIFLCSPEIMIPLISSHEHRLKAIIKGCSNGVHGDKPESGNPKSQIVWGFFQVCEKMETKIYRITWWETGRGATAPNAGLWVRQWQFVRWSLLSVLAESPVSARKQGQQPQNLRSLAVQRSGHLMRKYRLTYYMQEKSSEGKRLIHSCRKILVNYWRTRIQIILSIGIAAAWLQSFADRVSP